MATPFSPSSLQVTQSGPSAAPPTRRLKWMRFNTSWDLILQKTVSAVEAHLAHFGDGQRRFEECLIFFLSSAPY
eukprot:IDg9715t1